VGLPGRSTLSRRGRGGEIEYAVLRVEPTRLNKLTGRREPIELIVPHQTRSDEFLYHQVERLAKIVDRRDDLSIMLGEAICHGLCLHLVSEYCADCEPQRERRPVVTTYLPRKAFPPGRLLSEELEQRGWSQADFAQIIGRPPRVVNEIIKAKRAITPETALAFSGALNTGAEFWMNMESSYQLSKVRIELAPIARRARMYERFPIREMQKRGWIPITRNLDKLERSLLEFFGIDAVDSDLNLAHAAKRTSYEVVLPTQAAWLSRARSSMR